MGLVGQVHPTLASQYDAKGPVFVAELEWSWIAKGLGDVPQHRPISKYPAVSRDFAIIGLTERPFSEIEELIGELRQGDPAFGAVFQEMSLFDVYSGAPIPEGKRSLAVTLTYRSSERTLTDVEIQAADQAFLGAIHSRGYELR
jgi:phenylalanyl-tRNA synthetase beta chain